MLSKWPIRKKLLLGVGLLLLLVATLAGSGSYGLYAYRGLVKSLSSRSTELPLAAELSRHVSELRLTLSVVATRQLAPGLAAEPTLLDGQLLREQFRMDLQAVGDTLSRYRAQLDQNSRQAESQIGDDQAERETLAKIEAALARIAVSDDERDWMLDEVKTTHLATEVEKLESLSAELPSHLRQRLQALANGVRLHYRAAIVITWVTTIGAGLTFLIFVRMFYKWIFVPIRKLVEGSRQVAAGRFGHRIQLESSDEMAELAESMNHMTARFEAVRDDLDDQVRERTRQVVRGEQLASVGFLAAGVAHEINNPLASIALCSESLESRVTPLLDEGDEDHEVIRTYLRMIQDEAFRCKEITEKLLDFSRRGDAEKQRIDLRELVQGVVEMVGHMDRYKEKRIELPTTEPVFVEVNPQELKQVVLNLLTNGLDSIDDEGTVTVEVTADVGQAQLVVSDDGCGMTDEVQEHLFEPFFTRRREGQGTGLGLSITFRIISEHKGQIAAVSDGPGHGSRITVTLPLALRSDDVVGLRSEAA